MPASFDFVPAASSEVKQLRTWVTGSPNGDLSGLTTSYTDDLVGAVNEVAASGGGGGGTTPDASTTVKGKIEIATLAEMTTGTDAVRAATPEGVRQEVTATLSYVATNYYNKTEIGDPDTDLVALYVTAKA